MGIIRKKWHRALWLGLCSVLAVGVDVKKGNAYRKTSDSECPAQESPEGQPPHSLADLIEKGVITKAEALQIQAVETEIAALYATMDDGATEEEWAQLDASACAIAESIRDLEEKVAVHLEAEAEAMRQERYAEWVAAGVLTPQEMAAVKKAYAQIDALYSEAGSEDEAAWHRREICANQWLTSIAEYEGKISAYESQKAEAAQTAYYEGLVDHGVINREEMEALLAVYGQIDALNAAMGEDAREAEWQRVEAQTRQLLAPLAPVVEKVDAYESQKEQAAREKWHQEMIGRGIWSEEEEATVTRTLAAIDHLFQDVTYETTEREMEEKYAQAEALYAKVQGLCDRVLPEENPFD